MLLGPLLVSLLAQVAPPVVFDPSGPQQPTSLSAPGDPLTPDTVFRVPSGPRIAKLSMPGSELVALRISIPVQETLAEAGAGRVLEALGVERALARATPLGVTVEGARTQWGISYTVVGTRPDFDFLAYLLREAVAEPQASEADFERRRLALRSEALRTLETPAGRLAAELRAAADPGTPPMEGTPASLDRLMPSVIRGLWGRTHRPEDMTVVVAGDIPDELLLAAFRDMPEPSSGAVPGPSGTAPPDPRGSTQVLRHWSAEAYLVGDAYNAHAPVVALLIADRLRAESETFEAEVQLWETKSGHAIVVLAAAYPGGAVRMRSRVRSVLSETRSALTAEIVRGSVARVRHRFLHDARTPAGLVSLVGQHMDATDESDSARSFLDALDAVTMESTRAFFVRLEARTPLRAEVRP